MIYLDYASTYPTHKEIINKLPSYFQEYDFNPSAVYSKGIKTKAHISDLRNNLSFLLNIDSKSLIFTSSATESLNTILKGINYKHRTKVIIWDIEHKAVLKPCETLKSKGIDIISLNSKKDILTFDLIKPYLDKNTKLVSLMHVNNETGALNNIHEIAKKIKNFDKDILIMSDMSQSFCKIDTPLENIDFAVMSGHKIGSMKGCGLLYAKQPDILSPLIEGGSQENSLRAGTENTIAISAFDDAVIITKKNYKDNYDKLIKLNEILKRFCLDRNFHINSPENSVPYIFNFSTKKLPSEVMVNYLSSKDIFVSSASACSGKSKSYVLEKMGYPNQIIDTALRVSVSPETTYEEIETFILEVDNAIKELAF
jgi:cysteine desulfurase